jgi:uncharacterized protein (TIGR00369 family)
MQPRIQRLLDGAEPSPAWRLLGIRLTGAEEGRASAEMVCREEMRNHQGVVHGGFISTLADSAMGAAMATVLPDGSRQLSFDLKLSFISQAKVGHVLRADALVVHAGRRTGVAECRIEADGRLVATATASFAISASGKDTKEADAGR